MSKKKKTRKAQHQPRPVQRQSNNKRGLIRHQSVTFSGPLPPPVVLEQYDRILPGAAERILTMAEEQSKHRRDLEKKVMILNPRMGLNFGFIIGLAGITGSVLLGMYGKQGLGFGLGFGTLASLVSVFIYGSKLKQRKGK